MTDEALKATIESALTAGDLWSSVDQANSQFLQVGYLFTHLVLNDAGRYESVIEAMQNLTRELLRSGKELRAVVRSTWEITDGEYVGPYYDKDLNLRAASAIRVRLKSGARLHKMTISFTETASRELQQETGTPEGDYAEHKRDMVDTTKHYVRLLLAGRGTADAWDPLWQNDDLTINADTVSWIRSQLARGK